MGESVFRDALQRLDECPAQCDQSCYRCLRSFRNKFDHGLLDRQLGAALLRYLLDGVVPQLAPERLRRSADTLVTALTGLGLEGVTFQRDATVAVPGVGEVVAPVLAQSGGRCHIFYVGTPLDDSATPTPDLLRAREYGGIEVRCVDDMVIAKNLPRACQQVIDKLA
jgi:hypothetical protein